jgi:hypothetical protein
MPSRPDALGQGKEEADDRAGAPRDGTDAGRFEGEVASDLLDRRGQNLGRRWLVGAGRDRSSSGMPGSSA